MSPARTKLVALAALTALVAGAPPTARAAVTDSAGDFLATYTGPQAGDLDLLEVDAVLGASDVAFRAVLNGNVGTTAGGFVAFGVNRGAGSAGLFQVNDPRIGAHALHDAIVLLRPNLTGTVVLIGAGGALTFTTLTSGAITVSGDTISGVVPLSLLPANGFAATDYTYVAWTRSGQGSNALVADFAPGSTTFTASVPEHTAWGLMILGFAGIGAAIRRRPQATVAE
jgi:hypothetical protein